MSDKIILRIQLPVMGAVAGWLGYILFEGRFIDDVPWPASMAMQAMYLSFFITIFSLSGAVSLRRLPGGAVVWALVVAGLFYLEGLRYDEGHLFRVYGNSFANSLHFFGGAILCFLPLPFYSAALNGSWGHYPQLFTQTWAIIIRFVAALLLQLLIVGIVYFSVELLQLVGIDIELWEGVRGFIVAGLIFGGSLAITVEMGDLLSPYLISRALRFLLLPMLANMIFFIAVFLIKGIDVTIGMLSVTEIVLTLVFIGVTLITAVLDCSDDDSKMQWWMVRGARLMALLLFIPALIAAYGLWLRVDQYGLTPKRIVGILSVIAALSYSLSYALSVLRGSNWRLYIRTANKRVAVLIFILTVLLFTPVLNPYKLSVQNQMARYDLMVAENRPLENIDLQDMAEWGKEGREAARQLSEDERFSDLMEEAIDIPASPADDIAVISSHLKVVPADRGDIRDLVIERLKGESPYRSRIRKSCETVWGDGFTGCVLLAENFIQSNHINSMILLAYSKDNPRVVQQYVYGYDDKLENGTIGYGGSMESFATSKDAQGWMEKVQSLSALSLEPKIITKSITVDGRDVMIRPDDVVGYWGP